MWCLEKKAYRAFTEKKFYSFFNSKMSLIKQRKEDLYSLYSKEDLYSLYRKGVNGGLQSNLNSGIKNELKYDQQIFKL